MVGTNVQQAGNKRSQFWEFWRRYKQNPGAVLGLIIVIGLVIAAISSGIVFDYETEIIGNNVIERLQRPSMAHWFGTDELGRDVFARTMYGARYSLAIGVVAVIVSLVAGVTLGAVAGFAGGAVENIIMRIMDIFAAIPSILMAMAIVSALGQSAIILMIAVGVTSVPSFATITRAAVLQVRNNDFVEAARAIGMPNWKIVVKHILPNSLAPILVQATLRIGNAIISASGLSFLGLGIPLPAPEWGGMLSNGRKYIRDYPYMTIFPGLAILITVIAFNLIGDGVRDALDPKLKN
ncbi:MAG: ABC transporter permease [Ruminococcaceae bacterium]|nr:ABC transporter permease [Oscillospiraceae bacterium]